MKKDRTSSRRRVLKGAIATYNGRFSTLACSVRDVSDTGCKLTSDFWSLIPDTFELIIELDGLSCECEVVWRRCGEVGVRFLSKPTRIDPRRTQVVEPVVPARKPSLRRRSHAAN